MTSLMAAFEKQRQEIEHLRIENEELRASSGYDMAAACFREELERLRDQRDKSEASYLAVVAEYNAMKDQRDALVRGAVKVLSVAVGAVKVLSVAVDDPNVSDQMKNEIKTWFAAIKEAGG